MTYPCRQSPDMLTIGSVFSGIGGFDLGFEQVGCTVSWQIECEPFCQRVLRRHFRDTVIHHDVLRVGHDELTPIDVLIGGFPCQDLSVAGQRKGLHGERSNLFFEFIRVLRALRPRWMVIENVPGFLSSHRGLDFALAIRELDACGYVGGWRVLDSQYFGLAQRRQRVFLVASPRECGDSAQTVLFESESGTWDSQASAEAGADVAYCLAASVRGTGDGHGQGWNSNYVPTQATCLNPGHEAKHTYPGDGETLNLVCGIHANQRGELRTSPLAGSLNGSRSGKQYEGVYQGERARALVGSMFKR